MLLPVAPGPAGGRPVSDAPGPDAEGAEAGRRAPGVAARASAFLVRHLEAVLESARLGPVLDVACGDGRAGLLLALNGARVLLVDRTEQARESLRELGDPPGARFRAMDLETPEPPDFGDARFGAVLVFRFLHRPLIPVLKRCLAPGGLLLYETYLTGQEAFGRPRRPEHLLRPGELAAWFSGWEILEHFEGFEDGPPRFMGRILCRAPSAVAREAGT